MVLRYGAKIGRQESVGRRRERLFMLWALAALVLIAGTAVVLWWSFLVFADPPVFVGSATDFPPGSVTKIMLETTFVDPVGPAQRATISPVPAYLVHDPADGFFIWYSRDTHSGCDFAWVEAEELFIDPCHGSAYTRTGAYVHGPASRNLDRFGVTVNAEGIIVVDVRTFQRGTSVH